MPDIYIEFSDDVREDFKRTFEGNFQAYATSSQVESYTAKIGPGISAAITALNTALQVVQTTPTIYSVQLGLSIANNSITFIAALIYTVSSSVKDSKKAFVANLFDSKPMFFKSPPVAELGPLVDPERLSTGGTNIRPMVGNQTKNLRASLKNYYLNNYNAEVAFSTEASPEFKEKFSKNFRSLEISARVGSYSQKIGSGISSAFSALTTGLQATKSYEDIQLIILIANLLVIFISTIIYKISSTIKDSKKKYISDQFDSYPNFFLPPTQDTPKNATAITTLLTSDIEDKTHSPDVLKEYYLKS